MKKRFVLLLLLLIPFSVYAVVDEDTTTTTWEVSQDGASAMWCKGEESNNEIDSLANATSGYYLYCIEISCENGVNVHKIAEPISSRLKCANGNTNPSVIVSSSGAMDSMLKNGGSCSFNGTYAYATEKVFYDCSNKVDDSSDKSNTSVDGATTVTTNEFYVEGKETPTKKSNGKIWIIVVIVLIVGGIGFYLFRKFRKNNQVAPEDEDI